MFFKIKNGNDVSLKFGDIPILRLLIRSVGGTKASKMRKYREIVLSERTISTD